MQINEIYSTNKTMIRLKLTIWKFDVDSSVVTMYFQVSPPYRRGLEYTEYEPKLDLIVMLYF